MALLWRYIGCCNVPSILLFMTPADGDGLIRLVEGARSGDAADSRALVEAHGGEVVVASIGDWWWWAALVLLPPLAAAVSWPFGRPRITNWHRWVLVGAAALTVGYAVWWYAFAN